MIEERMEKIEQMELKLAASKKANEEQQLRSRVTTLQNSMNDDKTRKEVTYRHIFVDLSNIWFSAQRGDMTVRLEICKLLKHLENLGNIWNEVRTRCLAGSAQAMKLQHLFKRYSTYLEDTKTTSGETCVDSVLHENIYKVLRRHSSEAHRHCIVLATGDGNIHDGNASFPMAVREALRQGFKVEVHSWGHSLASVYQELEVESYPQMKIKLLDDRREDLIFYQVGYRHILPDSESPTTPTKVCYYQRQCTREDCPFAHPLGRQIEDDRKLIPCFFGAGCRNSTCLYQHPCDILGDESSGSRSSPSLASSTETRSNTSTNLSREATTPGRTAIAPSPLSYACVTSGDARFQSGQQGAWVTQAYPKPTSSKPSYASAARSCLTD